MRRTSRKRVRRLALDDGSGLDNVGCGLGLVLFKVFEEETAQLADLGVERIGTGGPGSLGVEQLRGNVGARLGHLQVEDVVIFVFDTGQLARVDGVENGTGVLEWAALATLSEAGTDPAGVEQPSIGLVLLNLVGEHLGVAHGVQGQEGLGEARGEGGLGFGDTILGAGHLGGVARDKVEHGLGAVELGDGWQHAAGVTGKENDVGGCRGRQAGDLGVGNVLNGVRTAGVLGQCGIVIVDYAGLGVKDNVLQDRAKADSAENIWLLLRRQADALCVAAALNVEYTLVAPAVLVVTDERTVGVGRQGRLAGARKAKEESDIAVFALIG